MVTNVRVRFYDSKEWFTFQTVVDPYLDCFSKGVIVARAFKAYCAKHGIPLREHEYTYTVGE